MGFDYWLVHLVWTIPPALVMTAVYWPFFTRLELYKTFTLITIAVLATIPWDSYLIRNRIWSYPDDAVVGPTLFAIPLEELFFFVIQTYNTSLIYIILTKRLVLPTYLGRPTNALSAIVGDLVILGSFVSGATGIWFGGSFTYMGLILIWVCPFMLLQWAMCCRFLLALPRKEVLLSIVIPSTYLCMVDNLALQRGTWVIERDTKLGFQVFGSLDIEEFVFFWVTNIMVVFGLVAIDHAIAIAEYQIASSPGSVKQFPSYGNLILLYVSSRSDTHDSHFLEGLTEAVRTVSQKSQSMYMGSAMFQGGLRVDLLLLYYFCRVMDDLIDEAPDRQTAELIIEQCSQALRCKFGEASAKPENTTPGAKETDNKDESTAPSLVSSLTLLPASHLTIDPLLGLLAGFKTDLGFSAKDQSFPIETGDDLETYAYNVASVVAVSVLQLVFSHHESTVSVPQKQRDHIIRAAERMGQALQYVNIARDVEHDAEIGRVYIPTTWLNDEDLKPTDVLAKPHDPRVTKLRNTMLDKADEMYRTSVDAIDELPAEVRAAIRTVVESYMTIGKVVRKGPRKKAGQGKLKLSLWRRFWVARRAMSTA
ncbi:Bifunctional lycopene cyclase/phytoene synthase [Cladobotryum mycophilum]|uniref:Bifunctional lycopene cyclase/phytoene synthase n=1 Tax=Cladobotryum mycophilum TaxID=491253 RepID=A0ABR0SXC8_9HYPO